MAIFLIFIWCLNALSFKLGWIKGFDQREAMFRLRLLLIIIAVLIIFMAVHP